MKIVICGSMAFAQNFLEIKNILESRGFNVIVPEGTEDYCNGKLKKQVSDWGTIEGAKRKIENNLIKKHFKEIKNGDAILVVNKDKNGIENYIGGNSFLEIGFAYVLDKIIYVLNPLPEKLPVYYQELVAMQSIILNGDLSKIKEQ